MNGLSEKGCRVIDELGTALTFSHKHITPYILAYELANMEEATALCQHGVLFSSENQAEQIIKTRKEKSSEFEQSVNKQAEKWLTHYEDWKDIANFRERRKILEEVICLLQGDKPDNERAILLARAYLYRSMLFRPKGYTTPDRKIEALLESQKLAYDVLKKDNDNPNALRIWVQSSLELEKLKEFSFNKDDGLFLKKTAEFIKKQGAESSDNLIGDDLMILLRHAKLNQDTSCLDLILDSKFQWIDHADLLLFQAQSGFVKDIEAEKVKKLTNDAITKAPVAFSDPFWEDMVTFLIELRDTLNEKWEIWKPLSLSAWKKCTNRERRITNNVVLHWHWSQRKPLYDLAFLAADTPEKKAEIADSLKSRPALRYSALNNLKKDDTADSNISEAEEQELVKKRQKIVKDILETEDAARDRRYLKQVTGADHNAQREIREGMESGIQAMNSLPEKWVAVHFYLNEMEEKGGYAILIEKGKKTQEKKFDYQNLYQKFLQWQDVYVSKDNKECYQSMFELCKKIGETMNFLFDKEFDGKSLLFIPYGFLHHLPLHAAIGKDKEIFLNTHASRYLPAWHLKGKAFESNSEQNNQNRYLFKEIKYAYPLLVSQAWGNKRENNTFDNDVKKYLRMNPSVLTVLCHGRCDMLNPFRSRLLLKPNVTIVDLLAVESGFNGTRVLLGACESDMSPPAAHMIDEHLSLSTVFLILGAAEVTGGVYRLSERRTGACYAELLNKIEKDGSEQLNLAETLKNWQKKGLGQIPSEESETELKNFYEKFYQIIPFRIMGFPEALPQTDKETAQ